MSLILWPDEKGQFRWFHRTNMIHLVTGFFFNLPYGSSCSYRLWSAWNNAGLLSHKYFGRSTRIFFSETFLSVWWHMSLRIRWSIMGTVLFVRWHFRKSFLWTVGPPIKSSKGYKITYIVLIFIKQLRTFSKRDLLNSGSFVHSKVAYLIIIPFKRRITPLVKSVHCASKGRMFGKIVQNYLSGRIPQRHKSVN